MHLKLADFNREYEEQFIKIASKSITQHILSDVIETTMPEIYEAEGGGRISFAELFKTLRYKQRATKSLTGVAASLDQFLEELNVTETESEEYDNKEDEPEMPSWSKLTTKPNFR